MKRRDKNACVRTHLLIVSDMYTLLAKSNLIGRSLLSQICAFLITSVMAAKSGRSRNKADVKTLGNCFTNSYFLLRDERSRRVHTSKNRTNIVTYRLNMVIQGCIYGYTWLHVGYKSYVELQIVNY